jgi:hypothetical protein
LVHEVVWLRLAMASFSGCPRRTARSWRRARARVESFPHVRSFPVVNRTGSSVDVVGVHFLASDRPIPRASPAALARRLPSRAAQDLVEWPPAQNVERVFAYLLAEEVPVARILALAPWAPAITDDRPFNEYFLLRQYGIL